MPGEGILETVTFEAVYEDGRRIEFNVSKYVRSGDVDEAAPGVAREQQRTGTLPEGKIVSVQRATS